MRSKKTDMGKVLTGRDGLCHGDDTTSNSGSPRPSDSGFFMPISLGGHDKPLCGGPIRAEYNTLAGNKPCRLFAVVETRHSFLAELLNKQEAVMSPSVPQPGPAEFRHLSQDQSSEEQYRKLFLEFRELALLFQSDVAKLNREVEALRRSNRDLSKENEEYKLITTGLKFLVGEVFHG